MLPLAVFVQAPLAASFSIRDPSEDASPLLPITTEKSCQLGNAIRVSRSNHLAGIAVFTQNRWIWIEEGTIVGSNDLQREFNCSVDGIERMQDTSRSETKERFVDSSVYTSRHQEEALARNERLIAVIDRFIYRSAIFSFQGYIEIYFCV